MTKRVVSPEVLLPAAAALRTAVEQLDGAAEDIGDAGRAALSGAGQFAAELSEGAAVLSLAWSASTGHAGRSAATIGAVAEQAVLEVDLPALDARRDAARAARAATDSAAGQLPLAAHLESPPRDPDELALLLDQARAAGPPPARYADVLGEHWLAQALLAAGIDPDGWDPSRGAEANREIIEAVYAYYGRLYLNDQACSGPGWRP